MQNNLHYIDVPKEEEYALIARVQKGEKKAISDLLDRQSAYGRYARFAQAFVTQRYGKYPKEEVKAFESAALYGLYAAAMAFDFSKDCRLITLAYWHIRKQVNMERSAFSDSFANHVEIVHLSTEMMDETYNLIDLDNNDQAQEEERAAEAKEQVNTMLDYTDLTAIELAVLDALVLRVKSGIKRSSYSEIGKQLGIDRHAVGDVFKRAKAKLKDTGSKLYPEL